MSQGDIGFLKESMEMWETLNPQDRIASLYNLKENSAYVDLFNSIILKDPEWVAQHETLVVQALQIFDPKSSADTTMELTTKLFENQFPKVHSEDILDAIALNKPLQALHLIKQLTKSQLQDHDLIVSIKEALSKSPFFHSILPNLPHELLLQFFPVDPNTLPLHKALKDGDDKLINLLLLHCGHDKKLKMMLFQADEDGKTPYDLAQMHSTRKNTDNNLYFNEETLFGDPFNVEMLFNESAPFNSTPKSESYTFNLINSCENDVDLIRVLFQVDKKGAEILNDPDIISNPTIVRLIVRSCQNEIHLKQMLYILNQIKINEGIDFHLLEFSTSEEIHRFLTVARGDKALIDFLLQPSSFNQQSPMAALIAQKDYSSIKMLLNMAHENPNLLNLLFRQDNSLTTPFKFTPIDFDEHLLHEILLQYLNLKLPIDDLFNSPIAKNLSIDFFQSIIEQVDFLTLTMNQQKSLMNNLTPQQIVQISQREQSFLSIFLKNITDEQLQATIPLISPTELLEFLKTNPKEIHRIANFLTTEQKRALLESFQFLPEVYDQWDLPIWTKRIEDVENNLVPFDTHFDQEFPQLYNQLRALDIPILLTRLKEVFQKNETDELKAVIEEKFNGLIAKNSKVQQEIQGIHKRKLMIEVKNQEEDVLIDPISYDPIQIPIRLTPTVWIDQSTYLKMIKMPNNVLVDKFGNRSIRNPITGEFKPESFYQVDRNFFKQQGPDSKKRRTA